jgi:hypothetical protein
MDEFGVAVSPRVTNRDWMDTELISEYPRLDDDGDSE